MEQEKTFRRDDGIDFLRILSMFMVVCLHVLVQGGVLIRYSSHPSTYIAAWLLEASAMCAVNCYGLISGYVGVNARFRPGRFIELYLTVWFYTVGISVLYAVFGQRALAAEVILKSLFPISAKTYWYFSCYAALFFLSPYLNRMVTSLTDEERRRLMWTLVGSTSVATAVPKIFQVDYLVLLGGYSLIWLLVLYVLGACLKLSPPRRMHGRGFYIGVYAGSVLFSWLFKVLIEEITRKLYGEARYGKMFLTYTAPTMLLCGICLLLAFRDWHWKGTVTKKVLRFAAASSFAVYIIHTHPVIWSYYLKNAFKDFSRLPAHLVLWPTLLAAAGIFTVCTLVDGARRLLVRLIFRKRSKAL